MEQKNILCVVGPTACGKTKMGVLLARKYGGEVVSIDSMQIYKGMTIGTAAPTLDEMEDIPHHMVAIADPAENWSVAKFTEAASQYIQNIMGRGKLPVLVGGTGLYLDAVVAGRTFAPGSSGGEIRTELQRELAEKGIGPLLKELRQVDPEAAGRISSSDEKRILRALEVYRKTGKTISQHNRETQALPKPYAPLYIGLAYKKREEMWAAIDTRVDAMLEAGLEDEVRALLKRGLPEDATALQAIGYKELLSALNGERSIQEATDEIKLRSRQFAKRQLTWLRRNEAIHWIYWEKKRDFAAALQNATEFLARNGLQ